MSFVARSNELSKLHVALQGTKAGKLKLVFITGDAGVGKTALVLEFIRGLNIKYNMPYIASSRCVNIAGSQQLPYFPFAQMLQDIAKNKTHGHFWKKIGKSVLELIPEWIPLIFPLTKNIFSTISSTTKWIKQEFSGDGEIDKKYLMVQYANALQKIAETVPLILWIDDLQWADNATLEMIAFLSTYAKDLPILLICSFRLENVANSIGKQGHPIQALLVNLENSDAMTSILLKNFNLHELELFFEAHNHKVDKKLKEDILTYSGGNPLFIKEYINLLHAQKAFRRRDNKFQLINSNITLILPKKLENIVSQKLTFLDTKMRKLINYASVIGSIFTIPVLAKLLHKSELDVYELLNLLENNFKIVEEISSNGEYRFSHALVQQVIYEQLGSAQRKKIHLEIAHILEKSPNFKSSLASTIAAHFEKADSLDKSAGYYLLAGKNALALLALDDALVFTQKASNFYEKAKNNIEFSDALLQQVEIYFLKGELDLVVKLCDQGIGISRMPSLILTHLTFYYWQGTALAYSGFDRKAIDCIKTAITILEKSQLARTEDGKRLLVKLYIRIGQKHQHSELEEIINILNHAISIANKMKYYDMEVEALRFKGWVIANRKKDNEDALQIGKTALKLAKEQGDIWGQIHSYRLIAHVYRLLGKNEKAFTSSEYSYRLAKQHGLHLAEHLTLLSLAISWQNSGLNWNQSLGYLKSSIELANKYEFTPYQGVLTTSFHLALGLGLWNDAQQLLNKYRELYSSEELVSNYAYYFEGQLSFAQMEFDTAVVFFKKAISRLKTDNFLSRRLSNTTKIFLGLALVSIGDIDKASTLLHESYGYWEREKSPIWLSHALYALGKLHFQRGDLNTAISFYKRAASVVQNKSIVNAWPIEPLSILSLGHAYFKLRSNVEALSCALQAYNEFKKMDHFLVGEAAFLIGSIMLANDEAQRNNVYQYISEAREIWINLGLRKNINEWNVFSQKHKVPK